MTCGLNCTERLIADPAVPGGASPKARRHGCAAGCTQPQSFVVRHACMRRLRTWPRVAALRGRVMPAPITGSGDLRTGAAHPGSAYPPMRAPAQRSPVTRAGNPAARAAMPDHAYRRTRKRVVPHPPSPADNPAPHAAAPAHASRRTRERVQTHPPSLAGDPAPRVATPGHAYRRARERVSPCPPSLASNPAARTAAPDRADRRTRARVSLHLWERLQPRSLAVGLRQDLAPQTTPTPPPRRHPGTQRPLHQPPRTADGRATPRRRSRSHRPASAARADAGDAGGGVGEVWVECTPPFLTMQSHTIATRLRGGVDTNLR